MPKEFIILKFILNGNIPEGLMHKELKFCDSHSGFSSKTNNCIHTEETKFKGAVGKRRHYSFM
jgi:hypothetical protein